jgi:tryptophan halogenase
LFRETGRVFKAAEQLFAENSWISVMMGQGIMPHHYHPSADVLSGDELTRFMANIHEHVSKTVTRLPPHGQYVRQYCPAPGPT